MKKTVFVLCLLASSAALAQQAVKNPDVKARMDAMENIGSEMKTLGNMAKGKTQFDAKRMHDAIEEISNRAAELPDLFGPEVSDPQSDAKPSIWENYEDFVMKAGDLEMTTWTLSEGEMTPNVLNDAVRTIGETCQACHEVYRK